MSGYGFGSTQTSSPDDWKNATTYTPPGNATPPAWWNPSWGPYEKGVYGKRAPLTPDPNSVGFTQGPMGLPTHVQQPFMHSEQPARLDAFRRQSEVLLPQQFGAATTAALDTLGQRRASGMRQGADAMATQGVNPAAYYGGMGRESQMGFDQLVASAQQQSIAGESDARMNILGQITSALGQVEAFYDSMKFQDYLASKSRSMARAGMKNSLQTAALGGLANLATGAMGYGGMFGQTLPSGG